MFCHKKSASNLSLLNIPFAVDLQINYRMKQLECQTPLNALKTHLMNHTNFLINVTLPELNTLSSR